MADDWISYFTNVNGELASIRLNRAFSTEAPIASKPQLLWVWLYFRAPRENGMPTAGEAETLWDIEKSIESQLTDQCHATFVGCITTLGRREFYFYGPSTDHLTEAVRQAFASFEGYEFDLGMQTDAAWTQYYNVLFPSEDQMDSIENRAVLDRLEENHDIHERPRTVDHHINFDSPEQRAAFASTVSERGFCVVSENTEESTGEEEFPLHLQKVHAVTQEEIDRVTKELRALAKLHVGEYEGWGCLAETAD